MALKVTSEYGPFTEETTPEVLYLEEYLPIGPRSLQKDLPLGSSLTSTPSLQPFHDSASGTESKAQKLEWVSLIPPNVSVQAPYRKQNTV